MVKQKDESQTRALEDYIKKGLERGFNVNYIREVLVQHGHHHIKVETAVSNIMGLRYPEELKPHLEESRKHGKKSKLIILSLSVFVVILLLVTSFLVINYLLSKQEVEKAQTELEEVRALGVNIDDLSETMRTQLALVKEKDLTIEEKEEIIQEQIDLIEQINSNIEEQRRKINEIMLDIMNRMIGRMSE